MRGIFGVFVSLVMLEIVNYFFGFEHAVIVGMCLISGMMTEYMFRRR